MKKINNKKLEKTGNLQENLKNSLEVARNSKKKLVYYFSNLAIAYKSPDICDYFVQLYKEHFSQTFQALSYCKGIKPEEFEQIEEKKVFLKKRDSHLSPLNFSKFAQLFFRISQISQNLRNFFFEFFRIFLNLRNFFYEF